MIEFFNETICILLVIAITIVFLKTIYSHKYVENFQDEVVYYGSIDNNNLADRLLKDPEFQNKIVKFYKNDINTKVNDAYKQSIEDINNAKIVRQKIDDIPNQYRIILDKYKELTDFYKNKKQHMEGKMIDDLNKFGNLNDYNEKNLILKKKLKDFADTITTIETKKNKFSNGKILQNVATQNELTLVKNTNSGSFEKYTILNSLDKYDGQNVIYYLSINGGCLQSNTKGDFQQADCTPKKMEQFFIATKIKNNEMYNSYIKLSGNYRAEHIINILDTSIDYPFYIISPFNIPGYAVVELNKEIQIQPIRNDPFQQFKEVETSSFCEIINN